MIQKTNSWAERHLSNEFNGEHQPLSLEMHTHLEACFQEYTVVSFGLLDRRFWNNFFLSGLGDRLAGLGNNVAGDCQWYPHVDCARDRHSVKTDDTGPCVSYCCWHVAYFNDLNGDRHEYGRCIVDRRRVSDLVGHTGDVACRVYHPTAL